MVTWFLVHTIALVVIFLASLASIKAISESNSEDRLWDIFRKHTESRSTFALLMTSINIIVYGSLLAKMVLNPQTPWQVYASYWLGANVITGMLRTFLKYRNNQHKINFIKDNDLTVEEILFIEGDKSPSQVEMGMKLINTALVPGLIMIPASLVAFITGLFITFQYLKHIFITLG